MARRGAVACAVGWVRGGEWVGDGRHTAAAAAVVSAVPGCGEPGGLTGSCRDHTEAGAEPHHPATSINRHTLHAHTPSPPPHAGQPHSPLTTPHHSLLTLHSLYSPLTHYPHAVAAVAALMVGGQRWPPKQATRPSPSAWPKAVVKPLTVRQVVSGTAVWAPPGRL